MSFSFRCFLLYIIVCFPCWLQAQQISGSVYNEYRQPLPFTSITQKGSSAGVSANQSGQFKIRVSSGTSIVLVFQHVGYQTFEWTFDGRSDTTIEISLKPLVLQEVIVQSGGENPAYAIIRNAIRKRAYYNNQVDAFRCDLYTKDQLKLRTLPDRILGTKMPKRDRDDMGLDSGGKGMIYLSESVARIHSQKPKNFKMEVVSSRVSGSNSFGFTFPVFISLYESNVSVFKNSFSSRGFVSPIADNALHYYRYKMLGTFDDHGKMVYSIRVTPKRNYEPLFSGVLNIVDNDWRLHSCSMLLTKNSQLELIDTLRIEQLYMPVEADIWRVHNQSLYFNVNLFGIDAIGTFLSVYTNHDLHPVFDKRFFDRTLIAYDTAVNKRPVTYWDTIRPVPLEQEEADDYRVKDSLFTVRERDNNNLDTLRARQGKFRWSQLLFPGIDRTIYRTKGNIHWRIESLLLNAGFNTVEGVVVQARGQVDRYLKRMGARLYVSPEFRYGMGNNRLQSSVHLDLITRSKPGEQVWKKTSWHMGGGKTIEQFNRTNPVDPFVNTWSTLLDGRNVMKIYEKVFAEAAIRKQWESGISMQLQVAWEDRLPLVNTTLYTFQKKDTIALTSNLPVASMSPALVDRHRAFIAKGLLRIKPGQRYIQFPRSRMPIGSSYPTIELGYVKAISVLGGATASFDRWLVGLFDDKNWGLAGSMRYRIETGGFLTKKQLFFQDYKHFNANNLGASLAYADGFRLMDSYLNSTPTSFYAECHIDHHFNGLLTNKIPLLKKWKWNLVASANAYWVSTNNQYVEWSVGLENIFKLFRVEYMVAYQNGRFLRAAPVIGLGGLLANGFSRTTGSNTRIDWGF